MIDEKNENELENLESCYKESETCDKDVFAEMRSNVLIVSGQHYQRNVGSQLNRSLRDLDYKKSKRIRLTKNHTQKALNDVKDVVASMVPGVLPYPAVEGEIRHQKNAEINRQVWNFAREQNKWEDFRDHSIDNFFDLGEVCSKVYFNPQEGGLKGFQQKLDEDTGKPVFLDSQGKETLEPGYFEKRIEQVEFQGQILEQEVQGEFIKFKPAPDKTRAIWHGQVMNERFAAFDLMRDPASKDVKSSPYLIYRKMIHNEKLKGLIRSAKHLDDEQKDEILEKVSQGKGSTFRVFNSGSGTFEEKENHTLLKEKYYRQSPKYPKGYYIIWTEYGVLFEGEIPFGEYGDIAFPIKWEGLDRFESSARGFSPIKRVRPAQIEVNRCASKITEHQLTVGDDKVILTKGSKFERGVDFPGIRTFYTTGTPQYFQGKGGEQFVQYLEHNIAEIYRLLNVQENKNPTAQGFDPKAELFKMQRQKIKFSRPASKLERYFKEVVKTHLFLEQKYMTPEKFEIMCGSGESVNFDEYKQMSRNDYIVKLEEVSGDLETMMGKTMELETILQYSGKNLDEQTKISLMMQFPILNRENAFKHVTVQYKNIESDILQLERGEYVKPRRFDNHELTLKFLVNRMTQKDYGRLNPEIQQLFEQKYQEHEQILNQQMEEMREAQAGMIPTGGPLVRCDVYVNDDPNDPTKTSRMEMPQETLSWVKAMMEKQGLFQERLQEIGSMQAQVDISTPPEPQMNQPTIPM